MKFAPIRTIVLLLAVFASALTISPADATNASGKWNLRGGDQLQVNAWHCGTYVSTCSWSSSTKLLGSHPWRAIWIQNKATLEAHGFRATLTISKKPGAILDQTTRSMGTVRWTNFRAWIADNSGEMSPSWTTAYVSTRSCGLAKVTKRIAVSEKCVYAGAF